MKTFPLTLLASDKVFYQGDCTSLIIPVEDGQYGILANHANTVVAVFPGIAEIDTGEAKISAVVSYGMVKIEKGKVLFLTESCENAEDIDEILAKKELEESLSLKARQKDRINIQNAEIKIAKALERIKSGKKF